MLKQSSSQGSQSFQIDKIRAALKNKRQQIGQKQALITQPKTIIQWGLPKIGQRKLQPTKQMVPVLAQSQQYQVTRELKRAFCFERKQVTIQILPNNMYYPPRCSGYDMAYSKAHDTLFVYGGISCATDLEQGLKTHFYKFTNGEWSELRPKGTYSPMPRFGHSLTACQREVVLFGGVSQYKEKLKDRCFYADCSLFNPSRSSWRVLDATHRLRTRKSHAACAYSKYYIVHGGIDDSQNLIPQLSWINIQSKKPRWKSIPFSQRCNHKIIATQVDSARDFLAIFGGRDSDLLSTLQIIPITIFQGDLFLRDPTIISHNLTPRQMPIMLDVELGFIVFGGTDQNCQVVQSSWYYNAEKQTIDQLKLSVNLKELRGAKGVNLKANQIYILASNSKEYQALKIIFSQ